MQIAFRRTKPGLRQATRTFDSSAYARAELAAAARSWRRLIITDPFRPEPMHASEANAAPCADLESTRRCRSPLSGLASLSTPTWVGSDVLSFRFAGRKS